MYGTVFKLTTKTHCSHYSAERRVLDCMALSLNYQNSLLRINTSHTLLHSFSDGGGGGGNMRLKRYIVGGSIWGCGQ